MVGELLNKAEQATGIDIPDNLQEGVEKLEENISNAVNGGKQAAENAGKYVYDGAVTLATPAISLVTDMFFGEAPKAAGPETAPGANNTGGTNGTETGSVLENVDLFDLGSLGDAIAEVRRQIANGEGDRTQLFQDLQLLLQSQMQLVSMLSNIQKVQHDTAMAAINNIR